MTKPDAVEYVTVAELIAFLQAQPQDLLVAHRCCSEQVLLDTDGIEVVRLTRHRPDGWIQNLRADMPQQDYLLLF